jgi:ABC-type nitrate/sulfonate/bicarbonate transport system substrate-binding protein
MTVEPRRPRFFDYKRLFVVSSTLLVVLALATGYLALNLVQNRTTVTTTLSAESESLVPEMKSVVVAETVNTYSADGPIFIGTEKGYFQRVGLDVSVITTVNLLQAVESGQVQFAISSPPFAADAGGADLIAVGRMLTDFPGAIIASSSITSLSGLNGKTFGCTSVGSVTCLMAYLLIKSQNWTYSPSLIKPIGSQSALIAALERGDVQGIVFNWGTADQLRSQGSANILGDITTYVPTWYSSSVITTRDFALTHPNTVRLFLAAFYQSNDWITEHSNETISWIQSQYQVNLAQAELLYNTTQFSLIGIMEPAVMEYMYNVTASQLSISLPSVQSTYTNGYLPSLTFTP